MYGLPVRRIGGDLTAPGHRSCPQRVAPATYMAISADVTVRTYRLRDRQALQTRQLLSTSSARFLQPPQLVSLLSGTLYLSFIDETHAAAQSHHTTHTPDPLRRRFCRRVSFHFRRVSPLLGGLGLYGPVVPPHAAYLGVFPEARSSARGASAANPGKDRRAENHHSLGPINCLCVLAYPRLGLPLRLVLRPPLADHSFPSPCIRRLSHHALGHEREQLCFSHRPSRGGAQSDLHRTLSPRPASDVLRRSSYAALSSGPGSRGDDWSRDPFLRSSSELSVRVSLRGKDRAGQAATIARSNCLHSRRQ